MVRVLPAGNAVAEATFAVATSHRADFHAAQLADFERRGREEDCDIEQRRRDRERERAELEYRANSSHQLGQIQAAVTQGQRGPQTRAPVAGSRPASGAAPARSTSGATAITADTTRPNPAAHGGSAAAGTAGRAGGRGTTGRGGGRGGGRGTAGRGGGRSAGPRQATAARSNLVPRSASRPTSRPGATRPTTRTSSSSAGRTRAQRAAAAVAAPAEAEAAELASPAMMTDGPVHYPAPPAYEPPSPITAMLEEAGSPLLTRVYDGMADPLEPERV